MKKIERVEQCLICDSEDVNWECSLGSGDCYCDNCAEEYNYTCKLCGSMLILIKK